MRAWPALLLAPLIALGPAVDLRCRWSTPSCRASRPASRCTRCARGVGRCSILALPSLALAGWRATTQAQAAAARSAPVGAATTRERRGAGRFVAALGTRSWARSRALVVASLMWMPVWMLSPCMAEPCAREPAALRHAALACARAGVAGLRAH